MTIDIEKAIVFWKGTKMRGMGKHEGVILFSSGELYTNGQVLKGGEFMVDMSTIEVTDIPVHEQIPRQNLIDHLKSKDFFNVDSFSTASLFLKEVTYVTTDSILISAELEIKGIVRSVTFFSTKKGNQLKARLTVNRFDWDINFQGNWLKNTLVDAEFELTVILVIETPLF
jgi:polyisoprenoid-binding protein YceI